MASPTQWTWVWVNSGSWWWTGKPGMLQSMGSQRVRHDWATQLNWSNILACCLLNSYAEPVGASLVSQLVKNLPAMQRTKCDPWVGKIPWRKKWLPTPVFLPGEFSPWGGKESDMTEQLSLKNLKRSSILSGSWVGFLIKIHGIDEICIPLRVGLWRKLSAGELMLLNCGVGEDSWESLGLQGDPTSPF